MIDGRRQRAVAAADEHESDVTERLARGGCIAAAHGELRPDDVLGARRSDQRAQRGAERIVLAVRGAEVERQRRFFARQRQRGFEVGLGAEMPAAELAGDQRHGLAQTSSFSCRRDSSRGLTRRGGASGLRARPACPSIPSARLRSDRRASRATCAPSGC